MKTLIRDLFFGGIIGIANIIPGVSGGTMALVLGFYERLIDAIHNINSSTIKIFLKAVTFKKENLDNLKEEAKRIDLIFLINITVGALVAVWALAKVMAYLLDELHDPTYGFFFGLVLISAAAPYKLITKKTISCLLVCLIAIAGIVGVSTAVSPETLIEKAELKLQMESNPQQAQQDPGQDIGMLLHIFLMGAVAISAMILPGVSGSFLLLVMGGYFTILEAINQKDVVLLGIFALGCLVGIVVFSRFLNFLLKKWHNETMAFLVGLVLGSLWMIWPFKTSQVVGNETIYLSNTLPTTFGSNEITTLLAFLIGAAMVWIMLMIEARNAKNTN